MEKKGRGRKIGTNKIECVGTSQKWNQLQLED